MKKLMNIVLILAMLLSLSACGSSESYSTASPSAAAPVAAPSYASGGGLKSNSAFLAEDSMTEYALDEGYSYDESAESGSSGETAPEAETDYDKIIYSADATVETTEFDATLEALDALIKNYKGFVESSSINGSNYYNASRGYASTRSAHYTVRIPSANFTTVMGELSSLGNIPYSHTYTTNITSQYYDTEARLKSYQAQEQTLIDLLDLAESVEDVIAVQSELTNIRYKIESLQSTLKGWDRQVSYSTVTLSINEVKVYTPEAKLSFGEKLANAFRTGAVNFWEGLKDFVLWFAESLPTLVLLGVIGFFVWKLTKKGRIRRREKRAAKKAKREAGKAEKTE